MTMRLARAIWRLLEVWWSRGGIIPLDAKSADSRCLSALWQKQGGEEETFSPAALRLYLYTRSIYLTRLLSYAYPTFAAI